MIPSKGVAPTGQVVSIVAVLALALLWFAPLGWRDLITPDEGRYAELALGMFRSGDWITPRLNGLLYFEKPPLQYWATAIAFTLLGVNEFTARLWPALCGAIGVVAVGWGGARLFGREAGWIAAAVLASSVFWVGNTHFLTLDAGVSAFLAVALVGFLVAQLDETQSSARARLMAVVWLAMALAMLSKGLIALVVPGGAFAMYLVVTRDWRLLGRLYPGRGLFIFALIVAPWFVLVSLRNPGFLDFFFIHEHLTRYTDPSSHRRTADWWLFLVLLPVGLIPWLPWFAQAVRAALKRDRPGFRPALMLLSWVVFVVAFFSLSSSKLPSYILPVYPALALLVGKVVADPASNLPKRSLVLLGALATILAIAAPFLHRFYRGSAVEGAAHAEFALWVATGAALVALAVFVGLGLLRSGAGRRTAVLAMSVLSLAGMQGTMSGHQVYAATKSGKSLVAVIAPLMAANSIVYAVHYYDQTLPFYLDRPITLVDYRDEFAMGIDIEPEKAISELEEFVRRWQSGSDSFAILQRPVLDELHALGLVARIVYEDPRRLVIAKP